MPAVVDKEKCTGCKSCEEACPNESIKVNGDQKAEVDKDACIDCQACEGACPEQAIAME